MKVKVVLIVSLLVLGLTTGIAIPDSVEDHKIRMPEKYLHMKNKLWEDPVAITAGEKIYQGKCSICHGEKGDGKGTATAVSLVKPADFADKNMVATMGDGYWFWRIAKGGAFPPFNSIMPAFENLLPVIVQLSKLEMPLFEGSLVGNNCV